MPGEQGVGRGCGSRERRRTKQHMVKMPQLRLLLRMLITNKQQKLKKYQQIPKDITLPSESETPCRAEFSWPWRRKFDTKMALHKQIFFKQSLFFTISLHVYLLRVGRPQSLKSFFYVVLIHFYNLSHFPIDGV